MTIRELGEWGLIDWVRERLEEERRRVFHWPSQKGLVLGPGDDSAAFLGGDTTLLCTTDTLVSGVHFGEEYASWREVGWKAIAVNLSDIAAMGGVPKYALVTLGLPSGHEVEKVKELYEGMLDAARPFSVSIIGGDMVSSPVAFATVTLIGEALHNNGHPCLLTRSTAKPGDHVAVTGYMGASAAGLKMLTENLKFDADTAYYLREAHFRPRPRVVEGQLLALGGVKTAIDVSDGLLSDLWQICQRSQVGAKVFQEKVPVYSLVKAAFPQDYMALALAGGEDYELLFTGEPDVLQRAKARLKVPCTMIGEIVEDRSGEVIVVDAQGREVESSHKGWDHFR